jgi:hypothetical protein
MPQILAVHESARFHFLYTDDESWLLYSYHERTRWVTSWDDAPIVERPSDYDRKTIVSVLLNGTGQLLIDILPKGMKICNNEKGKEIAKGRSLDLREKALVSAKEAKRKTEAAGIFGLNRKMISRSEKRQKERRFHTTKLKVLELQKFDPDRLRKYIKFHPDKTLKEKGEHLG